MDLFRNGQPRVVVTGLGAVTSLGDAQSLWMNLKDGKPGVYRLQNIETAHVPVRIGGEVQNFDPSAYLDRKQMRRMGRSSQFAIVAASQAIEDAGLSPEETERIGEDVAVIIGTTLGPQEVGEKNTTAYKQNGYKRPNPLALVNALPNMPAHYISHRFGTLGPLSTVSAACASGTQAIGDAAQLIRNRRAKVVITGGVEAILQDYTLAGFDSMTALATGFDDNPSAASRPFDIERNGFVLSEGCAIIVLESLEHAQQRGARIYAEILGYAASSDAFHVATLDPEGTGAARAMRWALEDAGLNTDDIQYINAHGTSTPANDVTETNAIKRLFGNRAYELMVSSTKSMLGHAMGGSGAIEVLACAKALNEQVIPPTINLDQPDPACDLDYVPHDARDVRQMSGILSNSFGLGGQNACIVLGSI